LDPNDLVSLGNVRRDYGDISNLLLSIEYTGIRVPLTYYPEGDRNILWDGHRRLLCVKIINVVHNIKENDPGIHARAIYDHLILDNASVNVSILGDVGHQPIEDVPVFKMAPPKGSSYAAEFQLVCAAEGLRAPLNPIDESRAMAELLGMGKKGSYVAQLLGKSESYVSRRSRLIELHPDFKAAIASGDLSPRAAEELLTLEDDTDESLRKSIIGATTQRRIRVKVAAANAAHKIEHQPALDIVEQDLGVADPLTLLQREEARLAVEEACKSMHRAYTLYSLVDKKPDIESLQEVASWLTS